jgi:rhodanese-related sulfurtransferase
MKTIRTFYLLLLATLMAGLFSCQNKEVKSKDEVAGTIDTINAFPLLIRHLERENDYINTKAPSLIPASDVYADLGKNFQIIDIRNPESYANGHIKGAVNLPMNKVLDHLLHDIVPSKLDKIIIVCENGDLSSYTTTVLRLVGYRNVFAMKFGMSAWHTDFAKRYWLTAIEKDYSAKLDTTSVAMPEKGNYPFLPSCESTCAEAMEQMASGLLSVDQASLKISIEELLENPEKYFIISYLPEDLYKAGHIAGSVQYEPRASLRRDSVLKTLPLDKTIVPYCYSGHQTAALTAYLNLIGYTAKNLEYGMMGFMNTEMKAQGLVSFSQSDIKNFPYVKGIAQ